jgi:hypothetical protein
MGMPLQPKMVWLQESFYRLYGVTLDKNAGKDSAFCVHVRR